MSEIESEYVMPATYLPRTEAGLLIWATDFYNHIRTTPSSFGLNETQSEDYGISRNRYEAAFNAIQNPDTRTPPNIAIKNDAKKHLINASRMLVDICQAWPQMTDAKRRQLKITERDKKPTPSPIPDSPHIKIVSTDGRTVRLSIQQDRTTKKKPRGVIGANVLVYYGDVAPTTAVGWTFLTNTGRTTVDIALDGVQEATTAWITAMWVNGRKQTSQAAIPEKVVLPELVVPNLQSNVSAKRKAA
jgi:hypothetical protein